MMIRTDGIGMRPISRTVVISNHTWRRPEARKRGNAVMSWRPGHPKKKSPNAQDRAGTVVAGVVLVVIGLQSMRMGVRRRDWRQRHPGSNPLEVARAQNANIGSAFGNDSPGSEWR